MHTSLLQIDIIIILLPTIHLSQSIPPAYSNKNKPGFKSLCNKFAWSNDLFLLKDRLLEFKINIDDAHLIEGDNQFPSSFYAYDFDGIKIQFLYNN